MLLHSSDILFLKEEEGKSQIQRNIWVRKQTKRSIPILKGNDEEKNNELHSSIADTYWEIFRLSSDSDFSQLGLVWCWRVFLFLHPCVCWKIGKTEQNLEMEFKIIQRVVRWSVLTKKFFICWLHLLWIVFYLSVLLKWMKIRSTYEHLYSCMQQKG
jgi:hypothetical protein